MSSLSPSSSFLHCPCWVSSACGWRRPPYSLCVIAIAVLCIMMPQASSSVHAESSPGQRTTPSCNISDATVCGQNSFLDLSGCCQHCSSCPKGMVVETPCNSTHDTQCTVPPCVDPHHRYTKNDGCVVDCALCSYDCSAELNRCICDPDKCYLDSFCQIECQPTMPTTRPTVVLRPGSPSSLPSWGIGLIAVGAVLGIVAFSAGFLFMGICTSKRRREVDSEGSESSSGVLVGNTKFSGGSNSTYLPGYPNQSLIDLLRQTNSPMLSSLGSVKSSPRSMRASPLPAQTEVVKAENYHLNTKSPIFFTLNNHGSPLPVRTVQVKADSHSKSTVV